MQHEELGQEGEYGQVERKYKRHVEQNSFAKQTEKDQRKNFRNV